MFKKRKFFFLFCWGNRTVLDTIKRYVDRYVSWEISRRSVQEWLHLDYIVDLARNKRVALARIGACNCVRNWNWCTVVEWKYGWSAFGTLRRPRNSRTTQQDFQEISFSHVTLLVEVIRDCDPIKTRRQKSTNAKRISRVSEMARNRSMK